MDLNTFVIRNWRERVENREEWTKSVKKVKAREGVFKYRVSNTNGNFQL
jgi:hypothetical protein